VHLLFAGELWRPIVTVAVILPPALWPFALGTLSVLLLISGLDDFVPLLICLQEAVRGLFRRPQSAILNENAPARERRIAIFVPCWHESDVIGNMVRHNLAAVRYRNFDFFLGVYPNDEPTVRAAEQLASEFTNVHVAMCPNPGPTSKADCLNGIYALMELFESESRVAFDTMVLHDAEDLIHPQALALIDRERARCEMVQVPVLPLKTAFGDVTHGVYCDEFAEYQSIDMRARQLSGSFVPSNGVGTAFAREVLDRLARERNYRVFDPASLTEDYEIGVHIHAVGYRQHFVPLARGAKGFVATREFFPRSMRTAIRQRTRWITGIALQCWQRRRWRGSWPTKYWFWRDRKGLITNPLSVVANVLFIAGVLDYLASITLHRPWFFEITNSAVARLCAMTLCLQCLRLAVRAACVGRIFGATAALTVPLRCFHANLINCCAGVLAVYHYFSARRQSRALTWHKTEHAYPSRDALDGHRRGLVDVLVGHGYVSENQIADAHRELDACGSTLDLVLLSRGLVSEEELCKALSLQSGLPSAAVDPERANTQIIRGLPTLVEKRYGVLPFDVQSGKLLLASAGVPTSDAIEQIKKLTELPVEFQLVTHSTYRKLRELL
jgi:adsorption protein B